MRRQYASKVKRLLHIYDRLQSGGTLVLEDLALEFHVSLRSLQRDMTLLQEIYIPMRKIVVDGKQGYVLDNLCRRPSARFTLVENIILTLALTMLRQYEGTGLLSFLEDLSAKVSSGLSPVARERLDAMARRFRHVRGARSMRYEGMEDRFDEILYCLIHQKKLRISTRTSGRAFRSQVVHPIALQVRGSRLYLLARSDRDLPDTPPHAYALEHLVRCHRADRPREDLPGNPQQGEDCGE